MKTFTAHLHGRQIGEYKASDKMSEASMRQMLISRHGVNPHVEVYERVSAPIHEQEDVVSLFFTQLDYLNGILGNVVAEAEGADVAPAFKMSLLELSDFLPQFDKLANMLKARFAYQEEVQKTKEEEK